MAGCPANLDPPLFKWCDLTGVYKLLSSAAQLAWCYMQRLDRRTDGVSLTTIAGSKRGPPHHCDVNHTALQIQCV